MRRQPPKAAVGLAELRASIRWGAALVDVNVPHRDEHGGDHQAKTKAKLRIAIEGELATVIERIRARAVVGVYLLTTRRGQRLSYQRLRWLFDRARDAAKVRFQFRDLRAKAATDMENLEHAQKLLGHATRDMTEHYTRKRLGEKVSPVRRKL